MTRSPFRALAIGAALTVAAVGLAGCATAGGTGGAASSPTGAATASGPALSGTLTVFAAASLTGVFDQLKTQFQADHPGVTVTISYGGSSSLATQITQGAPADVFASAAPANMKTVTDAGDAANPVTFTSNTLEIAVPPGNPGKVTGLADFAKTSLTIALCDKAVPCGAASYKLFADTGITPAPDTLEQDVKSVLTKVQLGEAQAGLVYKTDVAAAGSKVQGIDFPESAKAVNTYPIAVLKGAPNPTAAQAWVDLVTGPVGQKALTAAGFVAP